MQWLSGLDASFLYLEAPFTATSPTRNSTSRTSRRSRIGATLLQDWSQFAAHARTRLTEARPVFHGSGLNITVMSLAGNLDVGIISCPELLPDLWDLADDFAVGMEELLADVG